MLARKSTTWLYERMCMTVSGGFLTRHCVERGPGGGYGMNFVPRRTRGDAPAAAPAGAVSTDG